MTSIDRPAPTSADPAENDDPSAVVDAMPALVWRTDAEKRVNWMNRRLQAFLGRDTGFADDEWQGWIHPEDLPRVLEEKDASQQEKRPREIQFRARDAEGRYHWLFVRAQPELDHDMNITGWIGAATEMPETPDEPAADDHLLEEFARHSVSLLWTLDLSTMEVSRLSPNFSDLWPLPDARTWPWSQFVQALHEDDRAVLETAVEKVRASDHAVSSRFRVVAPNGTVHRIQSTVFAMPDETGRVSRIGGALLDLTPPTISTVYLVEPDAANQNRLAHALSRRGFSVKTFDSIDLFAKVASSLSPGCILISARERTEEIVRVPALIQDRRDRHPWLVLFPIDRSDPSEIIHAMKLGAADMLSIDAPVDDLEKALKAACSGIRHEERRTAERRRRTIELSPREQQILEALLNGGTNKTIAQSLQISPRTVETHRSHLMDRLGARNLADLITIATAEGLVKLPSHPGRG